MSEYVYRGYRFEHEPEFKVQLRKKIHAARLTSTWDHKPVYCTSCGLGYVALGVDGWELSEAFVNCVSCTRSMLQDYFNDRWASVVLPAAEKFAEPPKVGDLIDAVGWARKEDWQRRQDKTLIKVVDGMRQAIYHDRLTDRWYFAQADERGIMRILSVHESRFDAWEQHDRTVW